MSSPWVRKLENFSTLTGDDRALLDAAVADARPVPANTVLLREGDFPSSAHVMVEGFACRSKTLSNGRRQIVDLLLPGDICDGHVLLQLPMDCDVATLGPCRVAPVPHSRMRALVAGSRSIGEALLWASLVDEAVAREWILNVGRRPARQRIAHLLCEILLRLQAVGLSAGDSIELPLTQAEIADATGLSVVHTNRMLQALRAKGLIVLEGGSLTVRDGAAQEALAGFSPLYLHLRQMIRRT